MSEELRRELRDHIQFDHGLQKELSENQVKILIAMADVKNDLGQVKGDVRQLREKVIDGNGKEPLLTRVSNLELKISDRRDFFRWALPFLCSFGALVVAIFAFLK